MIVVRIPNVNKETFYDNCFGSLQCEAVREGLVVWYENVTAWEEDRPDLEKAVKGLKFTVDTNPAFPFVIHKGAQTEDDIAVILSVSEQRKLCEFICKEIDYARYSLADTPAGTNDAAILQTLIDNDNALLEKLKVNS